MGFGIYETAYEPAILRRNRITVAVLAVTTIAAVLVVPAFSEWPLKNAFGIAALLLIFHASLWWMFASSRAGNLTAPTSWTQWRKQFPTQL